MPAVKVKSSGTAPKILRVQRIDKDPPVIYEPDLVRVRAVARGFYAVKEVEKDIRDGKRKLVCNAILRNVDDVFDMDTADMRTLPLGEIPPDGIGGSKGRGMGNHREKPHAGEYGTTEIETVRGQFELPSWVILADESGIDVNAPEGHKTAFGKKEGEVL